MNGSIVSCIGADGNGKELGTMDGSPNGIWGKLKQDGDGNPISWHPLQDHSADVAACVEALLASEVVRLRLARLGGLRDLDAIQVQRLCVLAAMHDLGKVNHGFQARAWPGPGLRAGHVSEVLTFVGNDYPETRRFTEAVRFSTLIDWAGGDEPQAVDLLVTCIMHHGRLKVSGGLVQPMLWAAFDGRDPFLAMADLVAATDRWFPMAWVPGGPPLPVNGPFLHAYNGLLTLADWLASDPRFFPFTRPDDPEPRIMGSRRSATELFRRNGLDARPARQSLPPGLQPFRRIAAFDPRGPQKILPGLDVPSEGSITLLESETGSGKTEAALARFIALFEAAQVDGLYFALPTRTAATQLHRRVVGIVARAFPDPDVRPPVVLAVPGYLAVDDQQGLRLAPFEVLWNDDPRQRYRFRGWAAEHPKRYLAGPIVVGTIDQALLSALAVPHAELRAASLLRHLLVVDEVHASDAYMTVLLEEVLRRHRLAGGHALLMSATLGAEARCRLLSPGTCASPPPVVTACAVPFPLVAMTTPHAGPHMLAAEPGRACEVRVELRPAMNDPQTVAALACEAAAHGAHVLVLRNTVAACLAVQKALEETPGDIALLQVRGQVAPHHARFARCDRVLLDEAVEALFGKERSDGACIAVGTQTLQQSLDLDADLLITDLCPMDILLQRLGRLHRHPRESRPVGFERARAIVLVPEERDLATRIRHDGKAGGTGGLGTVYGDLRPIEATWRSLEQNPHLRLPEQCRERVEGAVHPEVLEAIVRDGGEAWQRHQRALTGLMLAHRSLARLNAGDWESPPGTPEAATLSGEHAARVLTRLGEEDRRACFSDPPIGPFGEPVLELTLPHYLCRGAPAETRPEILSQEGGQIRFQFAGTTLLYDRLGLRPEQTDPKEADAHA